MNKEESQAQAHKPCAFNEKGATKEFCTRTSGVPENALGACLSSSCKSPWRLCAACVKHGEEKPFRVEGDHDRLCWFHAKHSERAKRPAGLSEPQEKRQFVSTHFPPAKNPDNKKGRATEENDIPDHELIRMAAEQVGDLTGACRKVLDGVSRGLSDEEIARALGKSRSTVSGQVGAIYSALSLTEVSRGRRRDLAGEAFKLAKGQASLLPPKDAGASERIAQVA